MALITCPECGREISDKAVSCPGCGCPMDGYAQQDSRSELEKIVDDIYARNSKSKVNAIKELQKATGMNLKPAKDIMDSKFLDKNLSIALNKAVVEQQKINNNKERIIELKEERRQNKENLRNAFQTLASVTSNSKIPKCPRCKSTSISYTTKKLSLGRTAVGAAVAGAPGAVIGGLSSKKGYAVCLNCGKKWKI